MLLRLLALPDATWGAVRNSRDPFYTGIESWVQADSAQDRACVTAARLDQ